MAEEKRRRPVAAKPRRINWRALLRLGLWGACAGLALFVAVLASLSDFGGRRMSAAFASIGHPSEPRSVPTVAQLLAKSGNSGSEMRRLADTVRLLSEERQRLMARINTLERNEITGSIDAPRRSPWPASTVAAAGAAAIGEQPTGAVSPDGTPWPKLPWPGEAGAESASREPAGLAPGTFQGWPPAPAQVAEAAGGDATPDFAALVGSFQKPPQPEPSHEYGVDLGGSPNLDGLRSLWSSVQGSFGAQLGGLRPMVAVRDGARSGTVDLRLIAGPLDAQAAARLCAGLAPAGVFCQPADFQGTRLATR